VRLPAARHRRRLCAWLAGLLLLTQLLTAAYACPRLDGPPPGVAMAAMPGCTGDMSTMDSEQPLLCKAHCETGLQSLNSGAAVADTPPAPALPAALMAVLDPAQAAARAATLPAAWPAGPPAGTPPLYLRLLVLRN